MHFTRGGAEDSWVRSVVVDGAWDRWAMSGGVARPHCLGGAPLVVVSDVGFKVQSYGELESLKFDVTNLTCI